MNHNIKNKLRLYVYFVLTFSLMGLVTSPFWVWQLKETRILNVMIVDKTVPDFTYREHKGLTWLLNQNKYTKLDGSIYDYTEDYFGFHPKENAEFEIKHLPKQQSLYDLIYLTDGYGVYEEEFYGTNPKGERSESIYGGMTIEEVNLIKQIAIESNSPLIVEFNTFASPTLPEVRNMFYELLNLRWTGWIGRYFQDLDSTEVPVWVINNYQNQHGEIWGFTGNGLVFADENDQIIVVDEKGLTESGVVFNFTKIGEEQFKTKGKQLYNYWFDIIEAESLEEVIATYTLPLNVEGKKQLEGVEVPTTFPAVIRHQNSHYESYYFAGDYADQMEVPSLYQTIGLKKWREWFTPETNGSTVPFYWKVYVPMMDTIFENIYVEKGRFSSE